MLFPRLESFGGTWQETLQSNFDIVETFDDIADWSGSTGYHWDSASMPKKYDNRSSIWTYYTADNAAVEPWIKDHGAYKWGSSGKSLCINYNDYSGGIAGYGPSRLGTYFGDNVTGKSGYKKIYLFMMVKFGPGFFKQNADKTFVTVGTLKMFDICSGFTAINYWGTPAEHALTNGTPQVNTEYGVDDTVFNIYGGGLTWANRLFYQENAFKANLTVDGWGYTAVPEGSGRPLTDSTKTADITDFYLQDRWFGLEIASDIGTPNNPDGSIDVWIYNDLGNEVGHFIATNYNKLVYFDHYYNKVVLGGNRICTGYGACPAGQDNRWYVDDFIINNSRIGLKYFSLYFNRNKPMTPDNIFIK